MAFTWTPEDGTLAAADDAARSARYASSRNWIISGMSLSAGTGLNVAVSAGSAWIAGYYIEWDAASEQALTGSATNHVWIALSRDGNDNVTGVAFVVNTTGTPPSGPNVKLGTATTDGSSVTGTATTGRSPEVQADPVPENAQDIAYDNTVSGMAATNVKSALDELAARPAGAIILVGFVGQNIPVSANTEYLMEVVCVSGSSAAASYSISVPSGATATGYVEEVMPIANTGTANVRGARSVSILSYTKIGFSIISSVKSYGKLTVAGTAGNLNLSVTNMDSYSYIRLTKL